MRYTSATNRMMPAPSSRRDSRPSRRAGRPEIGVTDRESRIDERVSGGCESGPGACGSMPGALDEATLVGARAGETGAPPSIPDPLFSIAPAVYGDQRRCISVRPERRAPQEPVEAADQRQGEQQVGEIAVHQRLESAKQPLANAAARRAGPRG